VDIFRHFFEVIVEQCIAAGLVWGKELSIDSTDVEANAAIGSLQPRFAVEAHLARLFDEKDNEGESDGGDHPDQDGGVGELNCLPVELTDEARADLTERAADRHDWIGEMGRPDRTRTSGPYRRIADFRVSTTDPDASPLRPNGAGARLGYHDHYVVDGGTARIILTVLVTPAEVQDNQPAVDLIWRTRFRWKLHPRQVTGDTKYGTVENIVTIEAEQIHLYVPLSEVGQRAGVFSEQDFRYDPIADMYHCPGEKELRFLSRSEATHRRIYQAPATGCRACSFRERGTSSPQGRRISRSLDQDAVDRVRDRGVRQGDAQTQGLGGTALRRGQGVARLATVSIAGSGEGQHSRVPDRGGSEPETAAQQTRVGAAPMTERSSRNRAPDQPGGQLRVTTTGLAATPWRFASQIATTVSPFSTRCAVSETVRVMSRAKRELGKRPGPD
jgi:hypothetical protein